MNVHRQVAAKHQAGSIASSRNIRDVAPCTGTAQQACGCATMQKYRLISRQGEGTFSEVFKAQSVKTGRYTAIKCMKNKFDSIEQVRSSVTPAPRVQGPQATALDRIRGCASRTCARL